MNTTWVVGIDPGPKQSGLVRIDLRGTKIVAVDPLGDCDHDVVYDLLNEHRQTSAGVFVVEALDAFQAPLSWDTLVTAYHIGALVQSYKCVPIKRSEVKLELCGATRRVGDPEVKSALEHFIGPKGTAKDRGPLYHIAGQHQWAALAVAYTYLNLQWRNARRSDHEQGGFIRLSD